MSPLYKFKLNSKNWLIPSLKKVREHSLIRSIYIVIILLIALQSTFAQFEDHYTRKLALYLDGEIDYKVESGRVDILTDQYAIEVKHASDWKHSIGQSLWYAFQTNRRPGIVLIMKSYKDRKYGIQLQSALDYAELKDVKVWFYPEDFGESLSRTNAVEHDYLEQMNLLQEKHNGCLYWINTGSPNNTRHNQSCRWYNNTKKGRCTFNEKEGSACGNCGG